MKERPIIFSTPMVQAIMAGRKTVTRRLSGLGEINKKPDKWSILQEDKLFIAVDNSVKNPDALRNPNALCLTSPYGFRGDILWVRESFMPFEVNGVKYNYFRADDPDKVGWKGKPSIYMPKRIACRWLRVENVRVERLNILSHNDAILEGIHFDNDSGYYFAGDLAMASSAYDCFHELWVKIHGKESWDSNPWVWVINFSVLSHEESQKHLDNARA